MSSIGASTPAGRAPGLKLISDWIESRSPDRAFVALLLLGPMLSEIVNRVVGGARVVYDVNGEATIVGGGGAAARGTFLLFVLLVTALALILIARGVATGVGKITPVALIGVVALAGAVPRDQPKSLVDLVPGALSLVAAGFVVLSLDMLRLAGGFAAVSSIFQLVYSFLDLGGVAWVPCREDKCTPVGFLMQGTFWAENGLAVWCLLMLSLCAFVRAGWLRITGLLATLVCLFLTGSRVGYLAGAVSCIGYLLIRRALSVAGGEPEWQRPQGNFRVLRPMTRLISAAPAVAFVGSVILTFVLPPRALTFRGDVYRVVRLANADPSNWMFGAGIDAIQDYFWRGHAIFLMGTEHGEFPYLLNEAGVFAVLGFAWACVILVARSRTWLGGMVALSLLGPSLLLMTESTLGVPYRSPVFPLVLVGMACALPAAPPLRTIARTDPRWQPLVLPWVPAFAQVWRTWRWAVCALLVAGVCLGGLWASRQPVLEARSIVVMSMADLKSESMSSADGEFFAYAPEDAKTLESFVNSGGLTGLVGDAAEGIEADVPKSVPGTVQLSVRGNDAEQMRQDLKEAAAALVESKSRWSVAPTAATPLDPTTSRLHPYVVGTLGGALVGALLALLLLIRRTRLLAATVEGGGRPDAVPPQQIALTPAHSRGES